MDIYASPPAFPPLSQRRRRRRSGVSGGLRVRATFFAQQPRGCFLVHVVDRPTNLPYYTLLWMDGWMNAVAVADAIHCLVPGLIFSPGFELYVSSSAQGFFYGFCNVAKVAIDRSFIKSFSLIWLCTRL
jgi:hypothetical protein